MYQEQESVDVAQLGSVRIQKTTNNANLANISRISVVNEFLSFFHSGELN